MDPHNSPTLTDHHDPGRSDRNPLVWKLRVLYTGSAGIVERAPKLWEGRQPLILGRQAPSRSADPWLVLDDERVSREHARLHVQDGAVLLTDLRSKNGTEINGGPLRPESPRALADGDVVRVGSSFLLLRRESAVIDDAAIPTLIGVSAAACQLRASIAQAARSVRPVLLLGATGTGKEVAASALHALSSRRGPLVAVNCAAVPETLADGMFFGVQRGAFTGAVPGVGLFGEADQGTLFLDEVGDLPAALQPKLLRAIERREVLPVGGTRPVPCDVHLVAAASRDLEAVAARGEFREELFARLAGSVVRLPLLRERREDILLLARHLAGGVFQPTARLVSALLLHGWPLNVRQLGNVVGQLKDGLSEEALLASLNRTAPALAKEAAEPEPARPRPWQSGDPPPSRETLCALLEKHEGSLRRIEAHEGYSRRQFRRWVDQHEIDLERYRGDAR